MTKRNGHLIQATKVPTMLRVEFVNGRIMQIPINPVESKTIVAPDGVLWNQVTATAVADTPHAPMGVTIIPHGADWSSPDQVAIVAKIERSQVETDLVVLHEDGSSETLRMQHPPGARVAMGRTAPQPELAGVVG